LSKKKETEVLDARTKCANAMLGAALAMAKNAGVLWKRGVADEAVVSLPSRIAYLMLESCTNVTQRKAGGEAALQMLGCAVDSNDGQLNTIVAALVDLMSTYDHVAGLAAELCGKAKETTLGNELLREIARLDANEVGIKNVAPFISELASVRPKVVLGNIPVILPLLESEVYVLRSAIVNSIGCILLRGVEEEKDASNAEEGSDRPAKMNSTNRSSLFDILCKRTRDVTSFTRGAALKVLNELTEKQSLPLDRVAPVTEIAIDRLRDKTVMVRRCAMQVSLMLSLCYKIVKKVKLTHMCTSSSSSRPSSKTTPTWVCSTPNPTKKKFVSSNNTSNPTSPPKFFKPATPPWKKPKRIRRAKPQLRGNCKRLRMRLSLRLLRMQNRRLRMARI
jgi:condensin complex subunit 1